MDGRWREWYESALFQDEALPLRPERIQPPLPEPLRQARLLARDLLGRGCSREEVFVRQGRLLADYEDEAYYNRPVLHYYTTYQSLSDAELLGYFGWRTRWRRGEAEEGPLSFVFLHLYELLNQIGVTDPMDGWQQLLLFWDPDGAGRQLTPYLSRWLRDYVIYYDLPPELLSDRREVRRDLALDRWLHAGSDRERLAAAAELSNYNLDRSVLYRKHPEEYGAVAARVLARMEEYYIKHRKQTMAEHFFGTPRESVTQLFESAVFLDPDRMTDRDFQLTPLTRYRRRYGVWTVRRTVPPAGQKRLGPVLREIDRQLRAALGTGKALKPALSTKWVLAIITQEVDCFLARRREQEARRVTFDLSRLSRIRSDADVTRERLMTDQERDPGTASENASAGTDLENAPGGAAPAAIPPQTPPEGTAPAELPPDTPLDPAEYRLLHCLLYGGDTDWLAREGLMASVLTDGINDKLFDAFGDTVLDPEGSLIEDYIDELKEMVTP